MRVSEICVKQIRVNQGLGVFFVEQKFSHYHFQAFMFAQTFDDYFLRIR